jgi:serine/threonine protein kinase
MAHYCPRCGYEAAAGGPCPRDGEPLAEVASHDLLGRRLGEYTVLARLGGGSYGTVYRAVHARSGMLVAIKLLHARLASPTDGERAARSIDPRVLVEARAAAMIDHPRAVRVLDLAVASDGRPYLVMQLLEGSSLASVLHRPLPVGLALALASDILEGLAAAHARSVVHRDLKPENVFVTAGRATLVDFGLAKLIADPRAPNLTITGEALGTPAYMAPEQVRGREIDARADVYAAGCVLFEMLAGRPPFEGATFAVFDAHLHHAPPVVAELRPEVPAHVAAVITRALAKDPAARWPTAAAMQHALRPPSGARSRRRWPLIAAGLAVAVIAVGVASNLASDDSTDTSTVPTRPTRQITIPPREPGEPADPRIDAALRAVADTFERGEYTRPILVRLRCGLEEGRAQLSRYTPGATRSYYRRMIQLIDEQAPGIEVARACQRATLAPAAAPIRLAIPPPLPDEPPLGGELEATLVTMRDELERGRLVRATALATVCDIYRTRDATRRAGYPATLRAFHRRYELLLRGAFPDLDAAECPRRP